MVKCPWSPNASCDIELFSEINNAFIIGSNSPDRREYIEMIKEVLEEFNLIPNFALDLKDFININTIIIIIFPLLWFRCS
ncbi:hypothetical protein LCGC14_0578620 [marine sediment metagenome]|uniref:Uncharacterized protein n=1 Tax=marine sediment metagenome TaxID=412755 RepID=A0A0F9S0Q0_9ZZZZ|nr:hypothetical protein [bacterium]